MYCPTLKEQHNWRGVKDDRLIYRLQDRRQMLDDLDATPWVFEAPSGCSQGEYVFHLKRLAREEIESIENEFQRRDKIQTDHRPADPKIIDTIKAKLTIEDVLADYTEVFYHQSKVTYRCTLHGEDSTPSGVIYPDQQKGWCFACNHGGDIFDMVQLFERISLQEAIAKLAKRIGLDTKPLYSKSSNNSNFSNNFNNSNISKYLNISNNFNGGTE